MNNIIDGLKKCKKVIISKQFAEYIFECETKISSKIIRDIQLLDEYGFKLGTRFIHRIWGSKLKLWELRTVFGKVHNRTLFFVVVKGKFLLTNAFIKSTKKVPKNEIKKAERLCEKFMKDYGR